MRRKEKQLDISDVQSPDNEERFILESLRLLTIHKKVFHNDGSPKCRLCRSLHRSVARGSQV